jgi:TRAP-type C4-dicarboxylate transport system substrate-binding protein
METEVYDYYTKVMYSSEAQLVKNGMKVIDLAPEEAKKFNYAFSDFTWQQLIEKMPDYGRKIYEVCKPHLTR